MPPGGEREPGVPDSVTGTVHMDLLDVAKPYRRCLLSREKHGATYSQRAQFLQPTPARGADGAVEVR